MTVPPDRIEEIHACPTPSYHETHRYAAEALRVQITNGLEERNGVEGRKHLISLASLGKAKLALDAALASVPPAEAETP